MGPRFADFCGFSGPREAAGREREARFAGFAGREGAGAFQSLRLFFQSLGLIFQSLGLKFRIKQYKEKWLFLSFSDRLALPLLYEGRLRLGQMKEKWLFLSFSARLALPLPPLGVTQSPFGLMRSREDKDNYSLINQILLLWLT